jgi:hypothetical protein
MEKIKAFYTATSMGKKWNLLPHLDNENISPGPQNSSVPPDNFLPLGINLTLEV